MNFLLRAVVVVILLLSFVVPTTPAFAKDPHYNATDPSVQVYKFSQYDPQFRLRRSHDSYLRLSTLMQTKKEEQRSKPKQATPKRDFVPTDVAHQQFMKELELAYENRDLRICNQLSTRRASRCRGYLQRRGYTLQQFMSMFVEHNPLIALIRKKPKSKLSPKF